MGLIISVYASQCTRVKNKGDPLSPSLLTAYNNHPLNLILAKNLTVC